MELEFKPVVAGDIDRLRPFYGLSPIKHVIVCFWTVFCGRTIIMYSAR